MTVNDDIEIARSFAIRGIPVFVSYSKPPPAWQDTTANPKWIDAWREGLGLCAVMGQGIDLIDVDPRSGGSYDRIKQCVPDTAVVGETSTPSGGRHIFIRTLGLHSRDGFLPGIDYKGGGNDGKGRGFAFIPPTIRTSKVDATLQAYKWLKVPDLSNLDPVDCPDLRRLIVSASPKVQESLPGTIISNGMRNSTLTALAGAMRRRGSSESVILAALREENEERCDPPLSDKELQSIAHSIARYAPEEAVAYAPARGKGFSIVPLSEVKEEKIEWWWYPRIAYGKITMVSGDPGLGKSELLLKLIVEHKAKALYISAEDSASDTILPRFRKLGGDVSKLYVLDAAEYNIPDLAKELHHLEGLLKEHDFDVVVLDPLNAFLPNTDINRDNQIRAVLGPLAKMAEKYGTAIICLRHLSKGSGDGPIIYRGLGSIGYTGAVRSELYVHWDETGRHIRVLEHIKTNIGVLAEPLAFVITRDPADPEGAPLFEWLENW